MKLFLSGKGKYLSLSLDIFHGKNRDMLSGGFAPFPAHAPQYSVNHKY